MKYIREYSEPVFNGAERENCLCKQNQALNFKG